MRIAFIASECEPWAKTGGLGDVVDALARTIGRAADGASAVDVFLPRYRSVPVPADAPAPEPIVGPGLPPGTALRTFPGHGYRLRLVEHGPAFDRDGFYGDDTGDYPDNLARFTLLGRCALQALDEDVARGEPPVDVLHVHDWQGVPAILLRDVTPGTWGRAARAATVLTIHNLAYHGWVDRDRLGQLEMPPAVTAGLGDPAGLDLLRAGIERAELVNTVSPRYAAEALTPAIGMGLDGDLRARGDEFFGILNGIDPELWDPSRDPALAAPYSSLALTGKEACRAALCARLGLDPSEGPILGVVGRLDPQKGFDLVEGAAARLVASGVRLAILGAGDTRLIDRVRATAAAAPGRVAVVDRFDRDLARQIYAGADLFLMPSRFEPCGQGQMIALRYGTPPIVRRTGGLADTVIDVDDDPGRGTGFSFDAPTPAALLAACQRAATRFRAADRTAWRVLVERAMRVDFSWESGSARQYIAAYRRAIARRSAQPSMPAGR